MEPNRERLKLILKNLKSLVSALESEIYSDPERYSLPENGRPSYLQVQYEDVLDTLSEDDNG